MFNPIDGKIFKLLFLLKNLMLKFPGSITSGSCITLEIQVCTENVHARQILHIVELVWKAY